MNLGSNWISSPFQQHWHFLNYFTQKEWTSINLFSSKICKLINEPENLWQILDIRLQVLLQLKMTEDIINRLLKRNISYSTTAATMVQIKPPFGNSRKFLNVSSKMCWIRSHFVEGRDIPNQDITDRKTNHCQSLQMILWCICTIQDLLCSNKQTHQLENCLNKPSDISKVRSLIIVIIIIAIKLTQIRTVQRLQNSMFHRQNPDTVISIFMTQILRQLWKKPKLFWMNQNCSKLYYV